LKRRPRSRAGIVLGKELRETFRDRRVLLAVVVSPLLVTPFIMALMFFFFGQKIINEGKEVLTVAVVEGSGLSGLRTSIETDDTLVLTNLDSRDEAEQAIRDRSIRAALIVPDSASQDLETDTTIDLTLVFDGSNEKSRTARGRLGQAVNRFNEDTLKIRLEQRSIDPEMLEPTRVQATNLASEAAKSGFFLGIMLPYIVILAASFGGMTSAFDLIAGEKEKGTLETLLVSPASRREIILGKLGTVCIVSAIAGLCSIAGLIATLEFGGRAAGDFLPAGITISYSSIGAMVLAIIPLTLTTSALLLVISAFARNPKEAQAYVFPFMIVIIVPAMMSFVLPAESGLPLSLVPILNTVMVMKQVLTGLIRPDFILLATVTSLVYAAVALRLVVSLFERESILFRI
jgi:sodium transport system permease protein